jgi:hypothetical protein
MAKKHKGKTARNKHDFYPTPLPLAKAICWRLGSLYHDKFDHVIEPSAGTGNFVVAAKWVWPHKPLAAIEINGANEKDCLGAGANSFTCGDFTTVLRAWKPGGVAMVVGNPPFSLASEHAQVCHEVLAPGSIVAFLLKMNFFGGKERSVSFWPGHPLRYLIPIVGRPSFTKTELASNDTNEYGVFVWEKDWMTVPGRRQVRPEIIFPHITWK